MIVVIPDREWHWYVASTHPSSGPDRLGHIGAEVLRDPDDDDPPRRPIGFRMPEPEPPEAIGLALPDWLLDECPAAPRR